MSCNVVWCDYYPHFTGGDCGMTWCPAHLPRNMPPADVVKVKHGKWINDKGLYKCSVCNEFWSHWWASVIGDERMNKIMKFCPNCGADMRGEE